MLSNFYVCFSYQKTRRNKTKYKRNIVMSYLQMVIINRDVIFTNGNNIAVADVSFSEFVQSKSTSFK